LTGIWPVYLAAMSVTLPISASTRRMASATATAGQTAFPYTFPLIRADDIRVRRTRAGTTVTLSSTDFTVSGVGNAAGGTVTLVTGALAGDIIDIDGLAGLDRVTGVTSAGRFSSAQIDRDFDLALIRDQELRRDVGDLQAAPGIAALQETVEDYIGSSLVQGPGISLVYDDTTGKVTVTNIGVPNGGDGNVVGPASSANNRVAVFSGTTGKLIADSGVTMVGGAVGIGPATTPLAPLDISSNDGVSDGAEARFRGAPNGTRDYVLDVFNSDFRLIRTDKGANTNQVVCWSINASGNFLVGTTNSWPSGANVAGVALAPDYVSASRNSDICGFFNRIATDGGIISVMQDGVTEGTISVAGTTVSYNSFAGSHWSQLADGARPEILPGTVCESIDAKCVWPGEDNDQLPKFKVSDTAASKRVYGVFMAWDNDWSDTNDALICGLGAYVIRIAPGVTVQGGDLVESAGNGCARKQADDVIRSTTIAKVTSIVKTAEYQDGSYTVPCTLYCG
jgi:hypothetical protein